MIRQMHTSMARANISKSDLLTVLTRLRTLTYFSWLVNYILMVCLKVPSMIAAHVCHQKFDCLDC